MTSLYVAGPMTGYPEWNFPAFTEAAEELREHGFEVVSPHEIDLEGGFDPSSDGSGFDLRAALERDVEEVLDADGLALLDDWQHSPGAVVEVLTAGSAGTPARPVSEWLELARATLVGLLVLAAGTGLLVGITDHGGEVLSALVREVGEIVTDPADPDLGPAGIEERQDVKEARLLA